jgi:hypothetical protein
MKWNSSTQTGDDAQLPATFSGSLLAMKQSFCNRLLTPSRRLNNN